jgi:hypothetical protein
MEANEYELEISTMIGNEVGDREQMVYFISRRRFKRIEPGPPSI